MKMTKTITKKNNRANNRWERRWAVIRATTGSVVRTFATRDEARSYKAVARGNLKIMDNLNGVIVR